ncbi:DUF2634 domain-containing protein [Leptotrichia sp. oral taxon 223]|jgi:hypothetical protein|uniref:DUF2634 domain-containing protein n=1 Tax=Leptotrichia sp. oral taxon 223 TaxID=712363 RepID=UPI0015B90F85|nr:DUF2634 domain-containing protein [Leptotrichia sp. oral taxon 223]NWO20139.1 DUF2634 domain-containing protein [Leptotrichia sp. oral taxon 223]
MIPKIKTSADITVKEQPTKTYKMELYKGNYILGFVDSQKAMEQAIYKIIRTERYKYIIYSWNYGIELEDLFGMPVEYCVVELERRISEALLQDNRITAVHTFEFDTESERGTVLIKKFIAETVFGKIQIDNGLAVTII